MTLHAVVGYKDFYNKSVSEEILKAIKKYPSDAILLQLFRINAYLFQSLDEESKRQIYILQNYFPHLSKLRKEQVAKVYLHRNPPPGYEENVPVYFNQLAIVHLIKKVLGLFVPAADDDLVNEVSLQNDLFDCILCANEEYYGGNQEIQHDLFSYEALWKLNLMQQTYIRDLQTTFKVSPIKFFLLHKFIQTCIDGGNEIISEFCSNLNIAGYYDYGIIFLDILSQVLSAHHKDGQVRWHLEITDKNRKMFESFSVKPYSDNGDIQVDNTHRDIVPRPFYFITDKNAAIIDFQFLGFLIDTALAFNLYQFSSLSKQNRFKKFIDFKSFLGKSFYEEFVCGHVLRGIFHRKFQKVLEEGDEPGMPDFFIVSNSDVFVIEVKSTSVYMNVLENVDVPSFKAHVDVNFLQQKGEKSKNKGIFQLTSFIYSWTTNSFKEFLSVQTTSCKIYPILIYTDPVLDIPGVNAYCNETFEKEVEEAKKHFRHIYPLTMINLNVFLEFYSDFKKDNSLLKQLIREYHKKIIATRKSALKQNNPYSFVHGNLSFTQYLKLNYDPKHGYNIKDITNDLSLIP